MSRLIRFSSAHPRTVLLSIVALTGLALLGLVDPRTGAARLRVDPSFEKLLPRDDGSWAGQTQLPDGRTVELILTPQVSQ